MDCYYIRGKGGGIRLNPVSTDSLKLGEIVRVLQGQSANCGMQYTPLRLALSMWSERHSRSST